MNAIEIRNLSKSFRGMYAVDHLNMTVPMGAIYGFIGENGSGKSRPHTACLGPKFLDKFFISTAFIFSPPFNIRRTC